MSSQGHSIIFERSLCVPEDLKKASVTPIFKIEEKEGESKEQHSSRPYLDPSKGEAINTPGHLVVNKLNISQKFSLATKAATNTMGCIRSIASRLSKVILHLYSALVRNI